MHSVTFKMHCSLKKSSLMHPIGVAGAVVGAHISCSQGLGFEARPFPLLGELDLPARQQMETQHKAKMEDTGQPTSRCRGS